MSATIDDLSFNQLLDEIERRLYDVENLIASSDGLGSSTFSSITITDGTTNYILDTTSSAPTGISVSTSTFFDVSQADVTWTAPSDGSANTFLVVWAKKVSPGVYETVDDYEISGNFYRINNLVPGQTYGVKIYSVNRLGIPSTPDPSSGFFDFTAATDNAAPSAPAGVVVLAAIRSLVVRWNQGSEPDVANGKGTYLVRVYSNAGLTTLVKESLVSGTVATFEDLLSNTTYWVIVYAIDSSGNVSVPSAAVSGTTGQVASQDLLDGAVVATKLAPGSANRLMDSSFEGSYLPRYWTVSGPWALDGTTFYHGLQSARFSTTSMVTGWGSLVQEIAVTAGETLYIEFLWGQSANTYQSHLKVDFFDKDGLVLGGATWFPLGGTDGVIAGGTVVTGSHVVPANAVNATVACMGGWSSDGNPNSVNFDGIYITSNPGLAWAPAAREILPAVTFADMIVADAIQLRHMSADSVDASVIKANSVATVHISTVGLDAGVVTFGTMSGDRVAANSADITILKTSTLTTADLTVNGGSIKIGNPGGGGGTSGVLINSQGIRGYAGTAINFAMDVSGTLSLTGNINSSTFTGGIIQGAVFQTSSNTSLDRIIIDPANVTGAGFGISFLPSLAGPVTNYRGASVSAAGTLFGGIGGTIANSALLASGQHTSTGRQSTVECQPFDAGSSIDSGQVIVDGGQIRVIPRAGGFPSPLFNFNAGNGGGASGNGSAAVFSIVGGSSSGGASISEDWPNAGVLLVGDYNGSSYANIAAAAFIVASDKSVKNSIRSLGFSALDVVNKAPSKRWKYKKKFAANIEGEFVGPMADDLPEFLTRPMTHFDGQAFKATDSTTMIGVLWGALQELSAEVAALKAAAKK